MAHFAKIEDGLVTAVVVVDNEHEADGEAYLNSLGLEGTWVQTSYNGNFRGRYAAVGDTYDAEADEFIPQVYEDIELVELVAVEPPALTE
jgi:hypothetical protein